MSGVVLVVVVPKLVHGTKFSVARTRFSGVFWCQARCFGLFAGILPAGTAKMVPGTGRIGHEVMVPGTGYLVPGTG